MKKKIIDAIKNHVDGRMATLTKAIDATGKGNEATVTFEITKNVGMKNQATHTETYRFEVINEWSDIYPKREWIRLDEIDDISIEAANWAHSFNNEMKLESCI